MKKYNFLLIDDDLEQKELFQDAIDEINRDNSSELTFITAINPEEAMVALYQNYFQAIIIDLKLLNDDVEKVNDEELSGNVLLNIIIEKEIMPIVVRTGFPERVSDNVDKNIVKVCAKEDPLYGIIFDLINKYSDPVFKFLGSRGEVSKNIKELFWEVIPNCFSNKCAVKSLSCAKKETVIIRYISSWFLNKYMFDETYVNVEPIEMYMFPNPIKQICTCDILEDKDGSYYVVLTPSCDLANKKLDELILCKIKDYDNIQNFKELLDKYIGSTNKKKSSGSKKDKEKLSKWFRNAQSESMRYHFLPKINSFNGGFIDFQSIVSLKYDKESGEIEDDNYKKIGVITEGFKRSIISRFSSYYNRQGQPEFNRDSVLEILIKDYL